MRDATHGDV